MSGGFGIVSLCYVLIEREREIPQVKRDKLLHALLPLSGSRGFAGNIYTPNDHFSQLETYLPDSCELDQSDDRSHSISKATHRKCGRSHRESDGWPTNRLLRQDRD